MRFQVSLSSWLALYATGVVEAGLETRPRAITRRQSSPESDKFMRRVNAAVSTADNYLYIAGGQVEYFYDDANSKTSRAKVNQTLALPLDTSWDVADVDIIETDTHPNFHQVTAHALVTGRSGGRDRLWSWGGTSDQLTAKLYVFTPDGDGGGSWSSESVPDSITRGQFGASTTCQDRMVYFGGRLRASTDDSVRNIDGSSSIALPGVLQYNFEDATWENKTSEGWTEKWATYQRGELVCADVKDRDPVVVAIGGAAIPSTNAYDDTGELLDMSKILFWDMKGEKWHSQKTGGQRKPQSRQGFCAVGAASKNGTYEIFVYGGWHNNVEALDDIWVLSLPAFRWFKIDATSTKRMDHDCARAGEHMISIGGDEDPRWKTTDELERGVGIFNLRSLEWQTSYEADTEYDSPDLVKEWYADGGLDKVEWESDEVKAFFVKSDDSGDNGDDKGSSSGDSDGSNGGDSGGDVSGDGDNSSSDDTPIGAIVGGVVGGVALLAIAGFLFWFLRRRRRRSHDAVPSTASELPDDQVRPEMAATQVHKSPYSEQTNMSHSPQQQQYYQAYGSPPLSELGPGNGHIAAAEMDAGPVQRR